MERLQEWMRDWAFHRLFENRISVCQNGGTPYLAPVLRTIPLSSTARENSPRGKRGVSDLVFAQGDGRRFGYRRPQSAWGFPNADIPDALHA